jgi:glycosyltransferase involved in cell wall biosynthesis
MRQRPVILLLVKVPPPITGATLMNVQVLKSELLAESFNIRAIKISYAKSITDLGSYNAGKFLIFLQIIVRLIKECIVHRPRFVYFQVSPLGLAFYRDLIYITIIKLFRINIVFHLHGKGIGKELNSKLNRNAYKYAFHNSEIICLSNLLTFDIENVYDGQVYIVNNGIPEIAGIREINVSSTSLSVINILFLSNLIISKGILDFIEALKVLNNKKIDFQANIVGAESDLSAARLTQLLGEMGLKGKVLYHGPKYGHEKADFIQSCDMLVFPTKNDVWGNVILEAMQFGKPVIATNEGAIPEIIDDGVTGFLVEKDSPGQIADKIQVLIANPALKNAMGQAGRKKYLEKYTIQKFEENLFGVFTDVVNSMRKK